MSKPTGWVTTEAERIAALERQLTKAQGQVAWFLRGYKGIGDQYKEMKVKLTEAQEKLKHQEPMIEWYKVMVEWFAQYVHSGESNQELLPRLARTLEEK